jgi:SAM-dependent methyltransferase
VPEFFGNTRFFAPKFLPRLGYREGMARKQFQFKFLHSSLQVSDAVWERFLERFSKLNSEYDPKGEYRKQFYFQYGAEFEGFGEIEPKYSVSVPRAIKIMELIEPTLSAHISAGSTEVAFIGSHCGGECIYFANQFPNAKVRGFEENPYFVDWCQGLTKAYGYKNLSFYEGSIETTELKPSNYDYVAAHGLLYMSRNPIQTINQIFDALKSGGVASFEVYVTKDKKPTLRYVGDGSGWGDTFAFSPSFLPELLKSIGFAIITNFAWGESRQIVVAKKNPDASNASDLFRSII